MTPHPRNYDNLAGLDLLALEALAHETRSRAERAGGSDRRSLESVARTVEAEIHRRRKTT